MWKDAADGVYGLKQLELDDGAFGYVAEVAGEYVPELIRAHGTAVTLWGKTPDENSYLVAAREFPYPTHHLVRYLNTRYFELDPRIRLRVREFAQLERPETWTPSRQMTEGPQLRRVQGMKHFLAQWQLTAGEVDLGDAIAYWWILPDESRMRQQLDLWQTTGHAAAIYQDELYELRTGIAGRRLLQAFGVTCGFSRVVIYVKPQVVSRSITTDTARTRLIIDGAPAPWDVWAQRFAEQLPAEIEQLINDEIATGNGKGELEKIRERLKDVRSSFRLPRYRRSPDGPLLTQTDAPGGSEPKPRITRRTHAHDRSPGRMPMSETRSDVQRRAATPPIHTVRTKTIPSSSGSP